MANPQQCKHGISVDDPCNECHQEYGLQAPKPKLIQIQAANHWLFLLYDNGDLYSHPIYPTFEVIHPIDSPGIGPPSAQSQWLKVKQPQ